MTLQHNIFGNINVATIKIGGNVTINASAISIGNSSSNVIISANGFSKDGTSINSGGGGGGGSSLEIGSVIGSYGSPNTGTWIRPGGYYSKSTYPDLAAEYGDVPDIAPFLETPTPSNIPITFSSVGSTLSIYELSATNGYITVMVGALGGIRYTADGINWYAVKSGTVNGLNNIKYANGIFVAVGAFTILTSPDGINWTNRQCPIGTSTLKSVAYGNGTWVAVSDGSFGCNICYSTDNGVTWENNNVTYSAINRNLVLNFNRVRWVSFLNLFIAVSTLGSLYTSPDGITWTSRTSGFTASVPILDIHDNGSTVVCVGGSGQITYSTNGTSWSSGGTSGGQQLNNVIFANNIWVAVGNFSVYYSTNGTSWTVATTTQWGSTYSFNGSNAYWQAYTCVVWTGTQFVAAGNNGYYLTSSDGMSWVVNQDITLTYTNAITLVGGYITLIGTPIVTRVTGPNPGRVLDSGGTWPAGFGSVTAYGSNKNITFGNGTYVVGTRQGCVITSTDALNWTAVPLLYASADYTRVRFLGGRFFAFGSNGIMLSTDAATWTPSTTLGVTSAKAIMNIAYNGIYYVAVSNTASTPIYYSSDGSTWTSTNISSFSGLDVAWSSTLSLFVAVGTAGVTAYSSDGVTWTSGPSIATTGFKVFENNGLFIILTGGGAIYTTTNGANVTLRFSHSTTQILIDVTYSSSLGLYVAVGATGIILTSPDGTTWTQRVTDYTSTNACVTWTGTYFIVNGSGTNTDSLLRSTDGIVWERFGTMQGINVVAQSASYLNNNVILTSTGAIQKSSDGGVNWQIPSFVPRCVSSGLKYQVQGSYHYLMTSTGVYYSNNGVDFSPVMSLPIDSIRQISNNGSNTFAVVTSAVSNSSSISVFSSNNGVDWTRTASLGKRQLPISGTVTYGIHYVSNTWIIPAAYNANAGITSNIYKSTDLINWTGVNVNPGAVAATVSGAASNGSCLLLSIAAAFGGVYKTTDGNTFTSISKGIAAIPLVANNNWFVGSYMIDDLNANNINLRPWNQAGSVASTGVVVYGNTVSVIYSSGRFYADKRATTVAPSQISVADPTTVSFSTVGFQTETVNNSLMVAVVPNNAVYPYPVAQYPLYSYDTANTFFVPYSTPGGFIYASA